MRLLLLLRPHHRPSVSSVVSTKAKNGRVVKRVRTTDDPMQPSKIFSKNGDSKENLQIHVKDGGNHIFVGL